MTVPVESIMADTKRGMGSRCSRHARQENMSLSELQAWDILASTLLPERKYRYKNGLQSVVRQLPFTLCSLTTVPHFPAQAALDCVSTI